jgi:BASS family bile acid:Na+ symporter
MYLFRRPRLLWNSILARNVAVPVIAIVLIKVFSFHLAIAITLGVLAVTPVPPLLPKSQLKSGTRSEYVIGLLVSQALLAIILVPVTITLMNWALGSQAHFGAAEVAQLVAETILVPLAAGMLALRFLPKLKRLAPHLLTAGSMLLIAGALPLFLIAWKTFGTLAGDGAMLALALFMIAGTAAGHLFGGPAAEDRTALAIATSSRHPGLALAIAKANFPEQITLVAGAVVIYLIFRVILAIPYTRWRRHAAPGAPRPHTPVHFPPGFAGGRR